MIVFGFLVPQPGIALGQTPVNIASVCGIFFLSGLQIKAADIRSAFRAYSAVAFGLTSILVLSPLLLFAIVLIPLEPKEFARGLALFVAMPTTVSSSVAMTSSANGNAALALFFSVATNILGVLTAPLCASYVFRGSTVGSLNVLALLVQLGLTIVLPLTAGALLQLLAAVRVFVARHKFALKLLSSAMLIVIPWTMMSQSSAKLLNVNALELLVISVLAIGIHCGLFALNFLASGCIPSMALPERKAVVICSAQKTINTALSVILAIPPELGDPGLLILPCIIFHFSQIIIDAAFVSRWALIGINSAGVDGLEQSVPSASCPSSTRTTALAQQCDAAVDESPISTSHSSGAPTFQDATSVSIVSSSLTPLPPAAQPVALS